MLFEPDDIQVSTYITKPQGWLSRMDNGVRIVHLPTGIEATCNSERSQFRNKTLAMSKLIEALEKREKEKNMAKPHKHAEFIKAWADGLEVEVQVANGQWADVGESPSWSVNNTYRIKPEREYPETGLTDDELMDLWCQSGGVTQSLRRVVNAGIKRYIQDQEDKNAETQAR
jgi:hypothetical protein